MDIVPASHGAFQPAPPSTTSTSVRDCNKQPHPLPKPSTRDLARPPHSVKPRPTMRHSRRTYTRKGWERGDCSGRRRRTQQRRRIAKSLTHKTRATQRHTQKSFTKPKHATRGSADGTGRETETPKKKALAKAPATRPRASLQTAPASETTASTRHLTRPPHAPKATQSCATSRSTPPPGGRRRAFAAPPAQTAFHQIRPGWPTARRRAAAQ